MATPKTDGRLDALAEDVPGLQVAVGTLAEDVAELRRALCELALMVSEDIASLSATNPLSRSPHVQAKVERYLPTMAAMAKDYMASSDTLQSSVQRIKDSIAQAHRDAERGRAEGAAFDRNREGRREMYERAGVLKGRLT